MLVKFEQNVWSKLHQVLSFLKNKKHKTKTKQITHTKQKQKQKQKQTNEQTKKETFL